MTNTAVGEDAPRDVVTLEDVKALAGAAAPCITLAMPIPIPRELTARLKGALHSVRKQLAERHMDIETASGLLAPIERLAAGLETGLPGANSLIAFRSPGVFRHYRMRERLKEVAAVGERFEIRPLLAALAREQRFHLLTIGRHVRLFRSTPIGTEELRLEGIAPRNMQESPHARESDRPLGDRLTGVPSLGSMRGVFDADSENEKEQERFRHFLTEVERDVAKLMQRDAGPLILAGVEYDVAIYRQLNTYPQLLEQAVHGSPEGVAPHILHERAWEIVSQCPSRRLQEALAEYGKQGGASLASGDVSAIAKAAAEGRVASLFLSENADAAGHPNGPLNVAAVETVLHGGWAFELKAAGMPAKASVAAVLRY
jgi:hypothetical protein